MTRQVPTHDPLIVKAIIHQVCRLVDVKPSLFPTGMTTIDNDERWIIDQAISLINPVNGGGGNGFLLSPFSRVSLRDRQPPRVYHDIEPLDKRIPYPHERGKCRGNVATLIGEFLDTVRTFDQYLTPWNLLFLVKKYFSFVPSWSGDDCDVSVHDQVRMLAAVVACMARRPADTSKNDMFRLVGGDFSGVQSFIYTIATKGALKTLRARSFYLEMLISHIVHNILIEAELCPANVILAGGGRFTLLMPNHPSTDDIVKRVVMEVNQENLSHHGLRLYVVHAAVELGPNGIRNVSDAWRELGQAISAKKHRKFEEFITPSFFEPLRAHPSADQAECNVCHKVVSQKELDFLDPHDTDSTDRACPFCRAMVAIGKDLFSARFIVRTTAQKRGDGITIGQFVYHLVDNLSKVNNCEAIWVINSLDPNDYRTMLPVSPAFIENYPDGRDEEILLKRLVEQDPRLLLKKDGSRITTVREFETLARASSGDVKLGILRMDVDSLGDVTVHGFPEDKRDLARISALSEHLGRFFSLHLGRVLRGHDLAGEATRVVGAGKDGPAPRLLVTAYAGGDDLFLVGAWNDIVEVARDIYESFRRYTGRNPDITISGGVVLTDPGFPLYKSAELAGQAEERAKGNRSLDGDRVKDSLALFGGYDVVSAGNEKTGPKSAWFWEDGQGPSIDKILALVKLFHRAFNLDRDRTHSEKSLHRNVILDLFRITEMARRSGKLYLPRMAYLLHQREFEGQAAKELKQFLLDPANGAIEYLHPVLVWIKLLTTR